LNTNAEKLQPVPISRKRATALLVIGGYINTGILIIQGLLLVPLYLHFIGAHLYGLWMASGGILGMLGVLNFGMGNLLVQRVANAYGQQNLPKSGAYFINGMLVYLGIATIFVLTGMLFSFNLTALLHVPASNQEILMQCFQLAALATGIGLLNECLRGFAQALLRPVFSMVAIALSRILGIAITTILLFNDASLWAIPVGMLLTEILILMAGLMQTVTLFRELRAKVSIDSGIIKEFFHVGGALFMARLGHALSKESDPLLITLFLRPEVTTAYMLTRKAADILFQILSIIYGSTHAAFSNLAGQGNDAKTGIVAIKLLSIIFILGLIGFVSYVGMNYSFVSLWVGKAFALDQQIILFIGLAFFISSLRNMVLQILNGFGEYHHTSLIIVLEGVGKVVLASLLLGFFGVISVPLSMVMASVIAIVFLGIKLKDRVQLKFTHHNFSKAILLVLILFGLAEIVAYSYASPSWLMFVSVAGIFVLVTSIICALLNWTAFRALIKVYPNWA
jgi:O-antigen/teichoic acid export membrane protein